MIWLGSSGAGGGLLLPAGAGGRLALAKSGPGPRPLRPALGPCPFSSPCTAAIPRFYEAIRSHAGQDYPEFEILFGVSDPADPALEDIERLRREFPGLPDLCPRGRNHARPTPRPGCWRNWRSTRRYPLLLVNDSDIVVEPGYLQAVTAPLADPGVGLVTCLYRAAADSPAARAEALGIATEFAPSVLVARLLGSRRVRPRLHHGVPRRSRCGRSADSKPLPPTWRTITSSGAASPDCGLRIVFAPVVVETGLGAECWAQAWRHQLRWSRTIRVSRPAGYYGYVVTQATLWSLVAFAGRQWWAGGIALAIRVIAGVVVGAGILNDRKTLRDFWLIPLRDLFGFAVWLGGAFGHNVDWRGSRLRLDRDGRICNKS